MRRGSIAALAIFASLALIAAGCGGDDDETTPAVEETTEEAGATGATGAEGGGGGESVEISGGEFFFEPSDGTVSEGGTIDFVNDGEIVHNYTVEGEDVASADLDGGESEEIAVDLAPGEYDVLCTIPGHAEQGMVGTLTVE